MANVKVFNMQGAAVGEIALSDEAQEFNLYFRVLAPERDVYIYSSTEGKQLTNRKTIKVNPGEMEHVLVKTAQLSAGEIVVDVKKEG